VTPTQYFDLARHRVYICRERTEAEMRRLAAERELHRLAYEERQKQQRDAIVRSRELLLAHLTPAQRKTFEENDWFVVKGGKTGRHYRIGTKSYAGNIVILGKDDKMEGSICCHADHLPLYDHHLAQKLALMYDEERFLRIGNISRAG
jgi:hypothetical protein